MYQERTEFFSSKAICLCGWLYYKILSIGRQCESGSNPSGYSIQTHPDYDTMDEWVTPSGWGFGRIIGQYNYTNYQHMVTPMSAYRYNWATGNYTDQGGNVVSFNEVYSNLLYSNAISVDSWAEAYKAVGLADEYIEGIGGTVQGGSWFTAVFPDGSGLRIARQYGESYSAVFSYPFRTGYASSVGDQIKFVKKPLKVKVHTYRKQTALDAPGWLPRGYEEVEGVISYVAVPEDAVGSYEVVGYYGKRRITNTSFFPFSYSRETWEVREYNYSRSPAREPSIWEGLFWELFKNIF